MAINSISLLPIKSVSISSSSSTCYYGVVIPQKSSKIVCQLEKSNTNTETKKWKAIVSTALAAAVITFSSNMTAIADLNKFEAETRGEFGIGSAAQFGSADLKKTVHTNENFRIGWFGRCSVFRGDGEPYNSDVTLPESNHEQNDDPNRDETPELWRAQLAFEKKEKMGRILTNFWVRFRNLRDGTGFSVGLLVLG
ncbi:putative NAC domain-containing protein 7-like [Capsicum annuum]|nr:putative NAC domain-containing protein 7-like [Capsicum annuum]KAF3640574.1 putative NAC domain-containing protein 7-like [Capsicum annuum]